MLTNSCAKILNKIEQLESVGMALRELNRAWHRRLYTLNYNLAGINVFNKDWDNLIILDACRFDVFKDVSNIQGELESQISRGSHTSEFLKGNFDQKTLHDVVYVTASPMLHRKQSEWIDVEFHDVINIWAEEGWDEKYGTVLPTTTTQAALEAAVDYPNKRLIVHYLQPHYPFLADTAFDKGHMEDSETKKNLWEKKMTGEIKMSKKEIYELYKDNLEYALPAVDSLVNKLLGKNVITSDHGNMIGDRSSPIAHTEWGHPYGIHTPELTEVPWLVVETGTRKEIEADPPHNQNEFDRDVVSDRLHNLGYLDK
jgi:hypothetical protein